MGQERLNSKTTASYLKSIGKNFAEKPLIDQQDILLFTFLHIKLNLIKYFDKYMNKEEPAFN